MTNELHLLTRHDLPSHQPKPVDGSPGMETQIELSAQELERIAGGTSFPLSFSAATAGSALSLITILTEHGVAPW
jgi:hypothetical protein